MFRKMTFAALLVLLSLGSACLVAMLDYPTGYPPVERFQRSSDLISDGSVSLRNFDGTIEIVGWDKQEVKVYAEKLIPRQDQFGVELWSGDWRKRNPRIEYEASDESIQLKTRSPDREGSQCVVDYFLSVPRAVNLSGIIAREGDILVQDCYGEAWLELERGTITVENYSGSLAARLGEGEIQALLHDLREGDVIRLQALSGDIALYLEPKVSARLVGFAPQGSILTEFELDTEVKNGRISAALGKGEARIFLTAQDGDIRIRPIRDSAPGSR